MVECDYCGEEFDSEKELHLHWGDEHEDEINSHEKEKVKKARRKKEEEDKQKMAKRKRLAGYSLAGILLLGFAAVVGPPLLNMMASTGNADFNLEGQPVLGNESAPVTVVAFEDYQCPVCQRFERTVFPDLQENYIETGKIEYRTVNYAFLGQDSTEAAVAAECVYNQDREQFWDFHHAVFENQGREHSGWVTTESMMNIANQSTENLDYGKLRSCIQNSGTLSEVRSDRKIANRNGVSSTPSIFVNGQYVSNWGYNNLKSKIDAELAKQ